MTDKPEPGAGDKPLVIYTTFPSLETAETVASALLDRSLIACANILPGMTAIDAWQGQRHRDSEVVMILKTRAALAETVIAATRARHPSDNPAIITLTPTGGSADFFAWIASQTASPKL